MDWRTATGSVAVLCVLAICAGVVTSLATANGLLLDSTGAVPAVVTLVVVVLGLLGAIVLAGPSGDWTSNPYW